MMLMRFPNGQFVLLAQQKLRALRRLCEDVSGVWIEKSTAVSNQGLRSPLLCDGQPFTYTKTNENSYQVTTSCIAGIHGIASLVGKTITVDWSSGICEGETLLELDSSCSVARGTMRLKPAFLCKGEFLLNIAESKNKSSCLSSECKRRCNCESKLR